MRTTRPMPSNLPRARRDRLLIESVGEELVIYDQDRHQAHHLNRSAAFVWRECGPHTTADRLAALLARELGIAPDPAVVWLALDRLEQAHLLQPLATRSAAPGVSRRQLLGRLASAGVLGALIPAVTSIVAPTPAQAQSIGRGCRDVGESCDVQNRCCSPFVCSNGKCIAIA